MRQVNKAIVMSDIHLGKDEGYLFSKSAGYENNRQVLTGLFRTHKDCDELILNGDILDLALAGLDVAYGEMKVFFSMLAETGTIKRIVYLPGNHDHHLWRVLGEQVEIHEQIRNGGSPPGHGEYACRFVDQRYSSRNPSHQPYIIFPHLWPKGTEVPEFVVKYPHHLLKVPVPGNETRSSHYLVTHGHFLEDLFKPINFLIDPNRLSQLEAFNNLWLESFDYYLGHSDELSQRVRELELRFLEGGHEAKKKVKAILDAAYNNMTKKIRLKFPVTWVVKFVLKRIIKLVPKKKMGQSKLRGAEVNDQLLDSIKDYITKYIVLRYKAEQAETSGDCELPVVKDIPTPFTFIFGHTHIPFSDSLDIGDESYPVVNTGGWLRSDGDASGNGKYAGIVVIDRDGVRWKSLAGKLK
jgi:metallophosphoesterase superfamily enzyme